jgi:hypothetical protein
MTKNTKIESIVDQIEYYANRFVGVDPSKHHPDPVSRLHAAGMLVDAEIMRRMVILNENK